MLSRWPHFLKSCVCVATARNQSWRHFRGACRLWSVLAWSAFLEQTETNEARNSNRKLQPNMFFFSRAFVFQLSLVPVAALGGHSFDARAPLRGEGDQHLKNVFFKWLGSEPIFFLIWLILLIPLISLTNPNMFVCACRYVIYQRIFLTARGSSIDSYVPRTAAVIPMPIPF